MPLKPATWALLALIAVLAGCGSSQSSSPTPATVTVTTPAPTPTAPGAAPAPTATTTTNRTTTQTTTVAPARTRTAPAPAFVTGGTPASGELPAAVGKVRALGFTPLSTATFDQSQTLRVLVAARGGSAGAQQAFFFDGSRYLGTDAASTSGQIAVTSHGDTDATLRYAIYRAGDPACCPSGGARTVRFTLDGGHLVALDPIPPVTARR